MIEGSMIYFLLFTGVCSALHQYYFVDKSLTWSDAQSHCRQYGGDLATVHGPENQTRLVELGRKYNSHLWIGLYDDVESWTWSLSENANYSGGEVERWSWPWRGDEPINGRDREGCVRMHLEAWDIVDCNIGHFFFCFDNNKNDNRLSDSSFIYVHSRKSWWDAQSYCREHHTDLPSIRNIEENKLLHESHNSTVWKWIGLHRNLRSTWSDGSDSSYRNWKHNTPPNRPAWTENNCTLALANFAWQWADIQCNSKFNFLCNGVPAMKKSFRIKLSSADIDPNDPELSEAILKQLHGKLKEKMVNEDLNLTWTKAPDGEIFHNTRKDEKQQHPEFADARCPLKGCFNHHRPKISMSQVRDLHVA
ncbi:lymphocyte antigen 75-like isoform X1 [Gadus morhua]|uniref:lymphocyte antigen 75-like isoform X1 n=1 Tax=Gadus morhua TaxID=8049 RepID=UPI0011B5FADF|nr:lymphocyte antigen 75-like isoform X1 [Gadus morhua]